MKMLTIGEYCQIIGLHPQTLRKLERLGKSSYLKPVRTQGNHRRYNVADTNTRIIGYARVSTAEQKSDLDRQILRLEKYNSSVEIIKDVGSGLNCNKRGLKVLIKSLMSGTVKELVLTYKDRLLRFGSEIIFEICKIYGVNVVTIEAMEVKTKEEELCESVLAILTVFSAKLYGARSHKNRPSKPRRKTTNTHVSSTLLLTAGTNKSRNPVIAAPS